MVFLEEHDGPLGVTSQALHSGSIIPPLHPVTPLLFMLRDLHTYISLGLLEAAGACGGAES